MEVTIANHHDSSFSVAEAAKGRYEFKKNVKFSTSSTKEATTIFKVEPVRITRGPNPKKESSTLFMDMIIRRHTLKEL